LPLHQAQLQPDIVTLTEPTTNAFNPVNDVERAEESLQVPDTRKFDRSCRTQHKKHFKKHLEQYMEVDLKVALRKEAKLLSFEEHY